MYGAASVTKRRMFSPFIPSCQSSFLESLKSIAIVNVFTFYKVSHFGRNTSPGLSHFGVPIITSATYLLFTSLVSSIETAPFPLPL